MHRIHIEHTTGGPPCPPECTNCMKSSYENVPPLKEALSSMRCQKKRDSRPWSPSRTIVTLAYRVWWVSSSRKANTIALRREAKSLPIFCSLTCYVKDMTVTVCFRTTSCNVTRRVNICDLTCDMLTPSSEFIPNKELSIAGSEDLPTHKNISTPLSSKKIPLLDKRSTVRLSTRGNMMRS